MRGTILAAAAAAAITAAAPGQAAIVYSNNFDSENGGVAAHDYQGFAGLTVTYPSVDLIRGVNCAGGVGGCVDLDGGLSGQLRSGNYSFNAGDIVTLRFSASGSRNAASPEDTAIYAFYFNQQTSGAFVFSSTFGAFDAGAFDGFQLGEAVTAPYTLGMEDVTFSFLAEGAGSFSFVFDDYTSYFADDYDDDDAGRIIDNISLDISPAPEPATWGTMLLGFGIVGAAVRRRRGAAAVTA